MRPGAHAAAERPGAPAPLHWREETSPAPGAVRVLVCEGPGAARRISALIGTPVSQDPRAPRLVSLRDAAGEALDEALLVSRGGERFELHLHGGQAVVEAVVAALGVPPAPAPADARARALARLAEARGERAARVLLDQCEGALERALTALARGSMPAFERGLARLLARGRRFQALLDRAPVVVLAGPANAGKSTLFNLLVGRERALVSARPGTTRDALVEPALLGELAVEWVDTAGEREATGPQAEIERAGQELAREWLDRADLVLWVESAEGAKGPPPGLCARRRVLPVLARADLAFADPAPADPARADRGGAGPGGPPADGLLVSALADPIGTRARLGEAVARALGHDPALWPPGAGVPVDAGELSRIEQALRSPPASPGERARFLSEVLGTPTQPWWR